MQAQGLHTHNAILINFVCENCSLMCGAWPVPCALCELSLKNACTHAMTLDSVTNIIGNVGNKQRVWMNSETARNAKKHSHHNTANQKRLSTTGTQHKQWGEPT